MKINKSIILMLILVFVVGFSFSVYYFKMGHSKLESALYELTKSEDRNGFAQSHGLVVIDGKVRVTIELVNTNYKLPSNFGGEESRYENLIQALVQIDKIEELADDPNIKFIRPPYSSTTLATSNV